MANPDMYPGHPHSRLLAEYARSHGSKCALIVHYGGSSNYRSYMEGDILILQLAYVEKKPYTTRDKTSANCPPKEEKKRGRFY
ncbi:MAG: hypothetical protein AB7U40_01655 [Methanobacteriales archaeon]